MLLVTVTIPMLWVPIFKYGRVLYVTVIYITQELISSIAVMYVKF